MTRPVPCVNCARPMGLMRVSQDARNPGQRVFSCDFCRVIEIRAPQEAPEARSSGKSSSFA